MRQWLAKAKIHGGYSVICCTQNPIFSRPKSYRRRNVIERLFCKLKNWCRVATRYDRLAANYLSAVALVAALIAWI
ncbi:transposase [Brucella anthropi]|nr:transposase [Brucella anthropi]KAB2755182.1 transposase [Brucella anthropi]